MRLSKHTPLRQITNKDVYTTRAIQRLKDDAVSPRYRGPKNPRPGQHGCQRSIFDMLDGYVSQMDAKELSQIASNPFKTMK